MQDANLIPGTEAWAASSPTRIQTQPSDSDTPRLRRPDRRQMLLEPTCVDERLPAEHAARRIWRVVERLDLSAFYEGILARGSDPGRAARDPKLLVALWLYAAVDGVGTTVASSIGCVASTTRTSGCAAESR
jgi:hypothetical protein